MKVKLKLNVDLRGAKAGTVLRLDADSLGNLTDKYWSRRLKDSISDKCVELFVEPEKVKPSDEIKKKKTGDK